MRAVQAVWDGTVGAWIGAGTMEFFLRSVCSGKGKTTRKKMRKIEGQAVVQVEEPAQLVKRLASATVASCGRPCVVSSYNV